MNNPFPAPRGGFKPTGENKMMKRIVLKRNGQRSPKNVEKSDLKAGRFRAGEHVMLSITGDCCYHRKAFEEFEVTSVEPCHRFGGDRETFTFERVSKRPDAK